MRGLELPEEEMSSRLSQSLLQASLLSYKDNSAPRSQYSHSHRSNSTRGDSENSSKYMYGHFNELAASAKKSIYNSLCLSKVLPTALSISAVSIDKNPTGSVEADPQTACIEKATIPQHTSKIF